MTSAGRDDVGRLPTMWPLSPALTFSSGRSVSPRRPSSLPMGTAPISSRQNGIPQAPGLGPGKSLLPFDWAVPAHCQVDLIPSHAIGLACTPSAHSPHLHPVPLALPGTQQRGAGPGRPQAGRPPGPARPRGAAPAPDPDRADRAGPGPGLTAAGPAARWPAPAGRCPCAGRPPAGPAGAGAAPPAGGCGSAPAAPRSPSCCPSRWGSPRDSS